MGSSLFDHYEQVVCPAIATDPRAAFPEFAFVRHGSKWVASGPKDQIGPLGVRHDRVAIVPMGGGVPSSFAVAGDRAVPFTCYVTGRTSVPTGDDFKRAVAELARRAGVDPGPAEGGDPVPQHERDEIRRRAEAQRQRAEKLDSERAARRRKRARELWDSAEKNDKAPVLEYLRGRGIDGLDSVPNSLRFVPRCYHEDQRDQRPAIVAAVSTHDRFCGVHRIYLDPDDYTRKAPIDKPKKLLGSPETPEGHGAVRLGALTNEATLVLAEGIETAVACQHASGLPAWACISAGGLERVAVPRAAVGGKLRRVVIAADNDESKGGRPPRGQEAAENAAERLRAMGLAVGVWIAGQ